MNEGGPAGQQAIRAHNLSVVLDEIARAPGASRAEISAVTGLTKTTVSSLVGTLAEAALVLEGDHGNAARLGRPATGLRINPDGLGGIGAEVALDYFAVVLVDLGGRQRFARFVAADNVGRDPVVVMGEVGDLVKEALQASRQLKLPVSGVSVAVPGWVDRAARSVLASKNLGWENVPVADIIEGRFRRRRLAAAVFNEADVAALGEYWWGDHPEVRDFLFVSGGIGVGAGIVLHGALFAGAHGVAGEIGHVQVDPAGVQCYCGLRGCLELVAGQEAILRRAGLAGSGEISRTQIDGRVERLVESAKAGERASLKSLSVAGRALGLAITMVVNVLDIESVVVGGIYTPLFPWVREAAEDVIRSSIASRRFPAPRLLVSSLGRDAAAQGAAGVMMRRMLGWPRAVADSFGVGGDRGWLLELATATEGIVAPTRRGTAADEAGPHQPPGVAKANGRGRHPSPTAESLVTGFL